MSSVNAQDSLRSIRFAIITASNEHTEDTDRPGSYLRSRLQRAGHPVVLYRIIPVNPAIIEQGIEKLAGQVDVIIFTGDTPPGLRNTVTDTVASHLQESLTSFSELYRVLAYEELGAASMLLHTSAGVYDHTLVFSLPGSLDGVKVGMEKLILPELRTLVDTLLPSKAAS